MPTNLFVIRDTREKEQHGWGFTPDPRDGLWRGTLETKLETGDYTLGVRDGDTVRIFDKLICIERKESITELANNLFEDRFYNELERMSKIQYACLLCEFNFNDLAKYPFVVGIPSSRASKIRVRGAFLLKKLIEIRLKYPTIHFMCAGGFGKQYAEQMFKEIIRTTHFTDNWLNSTAGTVITLDGTETLEDVNGDSVTKVAAKKVSKRKRA